MKANPGYVFAMACTLALAGCNSSSSDCACSTDAHPTPKVITATPTSVAAPVPTNSDITIYFNEAIDPASIQPGTVKLTGGSADPLTITASGNRITIHPTNRLDFGTTYTASVNSDIKDMFGNHMKYVFSYSFTTKPPPSFLPYTGITIGSVTEAVAIGDVNGDGRNDVVMITSTFGGNPDPANDYMLFVFLQKPDGTLAAPVKYATAGTFFCPPKSVALGDLTGDGKTDVAVGEDSCGVEIFAQQTDGSLTSSGVLASANSYQVAIGDVSNDGMADLVGIGFDTGTVTVWTQKTGGGLNAGADYTLAHNGYESLAIGDINGDGLNDIVVGSGEGNDTVNIDILPQAAAGGFAAAEYFGTHGAGDGIFTNIGAIAIGDINHDGRQDLILSMGGNRPNSYIAVMYQQADGSLGALTTFASDDIPISVAIGDMENDGRNDVFVLHRAFFHIGLYRQDAAGQLQGEELFTTPTTQNFKPQTLSIGDINGDGFPDAALITDTGLAILYNTGP